MIKLSSIYSPTKTSTPNAASESAAFLFPSPIASNAHTDSIFFDSDGKSVARPSESFGRSTHVEANLCSGLCGTLRIEVSDLQPARADLRIAAYDKWLRLSRYTGQRANIAR